MNRILELSSKLGLTLQIVKTAFAAALSWFIASSLLHSEYPYFAAVAAIITVQVTVADSVNKASQRIIGIIGGVMISMLLGHWFKIGAVSIFFIILIGMGLAKALRMNPQIISQVAISSLLVLAFGQTKAGYAYERIFETILGSGIAVLINALIIPQDAIPEVKKRIVSYSKLSALTLRGLSALLNNTGPRLKTGRTEVNKLIKEAADCRKAFELAEQSLRYNPLLTHKRKVLDRLGADIRLLRSITIQIRGIRRSLADLQLNNTFQTGYPAKEQLILALEATANCIDAFGQTIVDPSEEKTKRLSTAIQLARQEQARCLESLTHTSSLPILQDMGSILTDLSRIVAETERPDIEAEEVFIETSSAESSP
ncbi:aromatic acid exporter family protein [Pontibacter korlensis]|uniref:FUSC family protein n=1 Tax=Pontibacter korlensis TaxID=400092 RepID=UPI0006988646|nr:aromatic acid exporter family protein [Pontibacter korlensis]